MRLSLEYENDPIIPTNRVEKKAEKERIGFFIETAITQIDGRLSLPGKINVVIDSRNDNNVELAHTDEYSNIMRVYNRKLPKQIDGDESKAAIFGIGAITHELSHISTNFSYGDRLGSGDDIFDQVVEEGKAGAVSRQVLLEGYNASVPGFNRHTLVSDDTKLRVLEALSGGRYIARGFIASLFNVAYHANMEEFERRAGDELAVYIAGGLVCDKFMEISGLDAFEMHKQSAWDFGLSYKNALKMLKGSKK